MPRKILTEEQRAQVIKFMNQRFNMSERKIYTELTTPGNERIWEEVADLVGAKVSVVRLYYQESYLRNAFRDTFRTQIVEADKKFLEIVKKQFNQFKELPDSKKFGWIRENMKTILTKNEEGECVFHSSQLYDHMLNLLRKNGAFIQTLRELEEVGQRAAEPVPDAKPTTRNPHKKTAAKQQPPAQPEEKAADESEDGDYTDDEMPDEEALDDIMEDTVYFGEIDKLDYGSLVWEVSRLLEIFQLLTEEETQLQERLDGYATKVRNFLSE